MTTKNIPAPGSSHTSQEPTTAQRYREQTQRRLDDGCQACNMSKVYCDAIWFTFNRPCCGMCGHP